MLLNYFPNEILCEIGRIAILAGSVKYALLSGVGTLLSTHRCDQGIGSLFLRDAEFERLCISFQRLAAVRNVPDSMFNSITSFTNRYAEPMSDAEKLTNGMWTYLGGDDASLKHFGLFRDTVLDGHSLIPDWRIIVLPEIVNITNMLISADNDVKSFTGINLLAVLSSKT